jgi:hypothetical protein
VYQPLYARRAWVIFDHPYNGGDVRHVENGADDAAQ